MSYFAGTGSGHFGDGGNIDAERRKSTGISGDSNHSPQDSSNYNRHRIDRLDQLSGWSKQLDSSNYNRHRIDQIDMFSATTVKVDGSAAFDEFDKKPILKFGWKDGQGEKRGQSEIMSEIIA